MAGARAVQHRESAWGIGDKQRALEWLERACRQHNPDLIELTREPSFAGLHSDAKFRELVERIDWRSLAAD